MLEAGVASTGIDKVCKTRLVNIAETLKDWTINQSKFRPSESIGAPKIVVNNLRASEFEVRMGGCGSEIPRILGG